MSQAEAIIKPTSLTGEPITGGKIGESIATGTVFRMQVDEFTPHLHKKMSDLTGGTDTKPHFESNKYLYGDVAIVGKMIAAAALGIEKLVDDASNPCEVVFMFNGTRTLTLTVDFYDITPHWVADAPDVPVTLLGIVTDTVPTSIEA